jgi:Fur family zinc uptake transcriptional regulator
MSYTFEQVLRYAQSRHITLRKQQELILKILQQQPKPLNTVNILKYLQLENPTANRMTIYRAIEYLIKNRLIHKTQSNSTYSICQHISEHNCQILVCRICGMQQEIHSHQICDTLEKIQQQYLFIFSSPLEINGICKTCQAMNFST